MKLCLELSGFSVRASPTRQSVRSRLERLSRSERSEQGMRSRAVQAAAETIPCCRRPERSTSGARKKELCLHQHMEEKIAAKRLFAAEVILLLAQGVLKPNVD